MHVRWRGQVSFCASVWHAGLKWQSDLMGLSMWLTHDQEAKSQILPLGAGRRCLVKIRVSGRSCWNGDDWFVVILKLLRQRFQSLLEPLCINRLMGLYNGAPECLKCVWIKDSRSYLVFCSFSVENWGSLDNSGSIFGTSDIYYINIYIWWSAKNTLSIPVS